MKKQIGMRWAAMGLLAVCAAGCAGGPDVEDSVRGAMPAEAGHRVVQDTGGKALQCVPYAREHSGVKLTGDAYTWWDQAEGKYGRGASPEPGAVMVLNSSAHGHVAVVRRVVSAREIRIDHANWLNDGSIYLNDPVADVSSDNDWSVVKVWNIKTGSWGVKVFAVKGFISPKDAPVHAARPSDRVARAEIHAVTRSPAHSLAQPVSAEIPLNQGISPPEDLN